MAEKTEINTKQSGSIMASYGIGKFLAEFFTGAFGALVFFYYETMIHLDGRLVAIAIILYSIWNAVNDPIIGYVTSKPTKLSNKLGRRFPWIIFGALIWVFSFVLIFAVPKGLDPVQDQWIIFAWMVGTVCLYDFLYSIWEVNYQSVFPDKFRGETNRSKASGIAIVVGVLGIAGGSVLPTFIIDYEISSTFITNAWIFAIVGFLLVFLLIPGVREDKIMIERYITYVNVEEDKTPFFQQLIQALKERNFLAFILLYFFYQAATMSMTGSIHYVGDFILGDSGDTTIIFAGMLVGALISVPIWLIVLKKSKNNQKLLAIAGIGIAITSLPLTFVNTQLGFTIGMFFWGMAFGGFWLIMTPAMADVIDEIVVKRKKREDGVYMGFRAFFGRLSYAVQAISFWVVHELTGFSESAEIQSQSALNGIHIHMALIPAILVLIGVLIFWKMNTLTPLKVQENNLKLKELNL